ncbi:hypothetical protein D9M69_196420 [compost metagenome]
MAQVFLARELHSGLPSSGIPAGSANRRQNNKKAAGVRAPAPPGALRSLLLE